MLSQCSIALTWETISDVYLDFSYVKNYSLIQHNSIEWQFHNNITNLTDGIYTYYGWANDTAGNENISEIRTITINAIPPIFTIALSTPINHKILNTSTATFNFTATGTEPNYACILYLNDTSRGSDSLVINNTLTGILSSTLTNGTYLWYVNCTADYITNQSEIRTITISITETTTTTTTTTSTTTTTLLTYLDCYNKDVTIEELDIGSQLIDVLSCKLIKVKATSISPIYAMILFVIVAIAACAIVILIILALLAVINKLSKQ